MKTIQKQKRVSTAMQVAKLAKISHNEDSSITINLENFKVFYKSGDSKISASLFGEVMKHIMKIHKIENAIFDLKISNIIFEDSQGWILDRFRSIEIKDSIFYDLCVYGEDILQNISIKNSTIGSLEKQSGSFNMGFHKLDYKRINKRTFENEKTYMYKDEPLYLLKLDYLPLFKDFTVNIDNVSIPRFSIAFWNRGNVVIENFNLTTECWSYEIYGIQNISKIHSINEIGKKYFNAARNIEIEKLQKKLF